MNKVSFFLTLICISLSVEASDKKTRSFSISGYSSSDRVTIPEAKYNKCLEANKDLDGKKLLLALAKLIDDEARELKQKNPKKDARGRTTSSSN